MKGPVIPVAKMREAFQNAYFPQSRSGARSGMRDRARLLRIHCLLADQIAKEAMRDPFSKDIKVLCDALLVVEAVLVRRTKPLFMPA